MAGSGLTADGICKNGAVNVLTKDLPTRGWGMAVRVIRRWHGWKNTRSGTDTYSV